MGPGFRRDDNFVDLAGISQAGGRRAGRAAGFDLAAGLVLTAGFALALAGLRLAAARGAGVAAPLLAPAALRGATFRVGRRVLPFAFCVASSATASLSTNPSGSAPFGSEAMTPSWLT